MLKSIATAHYVNGKSPKIIASECGRSRGQVYNWLHGKSPCPPEKRQSLERSLGASVDWDAYDAEIAQLRKSIAARGAKEPHRAIPDTAQPSPPPNPENEPESRANQDNAEMREYFG